MASKELSSGQKKIEVQIAEIATEVRFLAKSIAENNQYTKEMVENVKKLVDDHEGRIREIEIMHQNHRLELASYRGDTTRLIWIVSAVASAITGTIGYFIPK